MLIDHHQTKSRFELTMGPKIYPPAGFELHLWSGYHKLFLWFTRVVIWSSNL